MPTLKLDFSDGARARATPDVLARLSERLPFKVDIPGKINLGYVEAPPRLRLAPSENGVEWLQIDIGALARSRFNLKTDLATRISTALGDAKHESRRVMLVLGDPETAATRTSCSRFSTRLEDADNFRSIVARKQQAAFRERVPAVPDEFTRTLADFRVVYVDVKVPDKQAELELKSLELQLKAAENRAHPQLNLVSSYQAYSFGPRLANDPGPPASVRLAARHVYPARCTPATTWDGRSACIF